MILNIVIRVETIALGIALGLVTGDWWALLAIAGGWTAYDGFSIVKAAAK